MKPSGDEHEDRDECDGLEDRDARYTVHLNDAKGVVFGDHAVQRNGFSRKVTGIVLAALAAVLLSGNETPEGASGQIRSGPSAPPGPSASSPTTSPTTRPAPSPSPSISRTAPPAPVVLPPAPAPAPPVRLPRPTSPPTPSADPTPKPSPTRTCRSRQQYRVNNKAQIWDAEGERLGDIASGTLFFREETASYPSPVDDRYYGTVDEVISGSATGYVLRKKLDYVGTVEICD